MGVCFLQRLQWVLRVLGTTTISGNRFSAFSWKMAYQAQASVDQFLANSGISPHWAISAIGDYLNNIKVRLHNLMNYVMPAFDRAQSSKISISHKLEEYVSQSKLEAHHRVAHFTKSIPVALSTFFQDTSCMMFSVLSAYLAFAIVVIGRSVDCISDTVSSLNSKVASVTAYISSCCTSQSSECMSAFHSLHDEKHQTSKAKKRL